MLLYGIFSSSVLGFFHKSFLSATTHHNIWSWSPLAFLLIAVVRSLVVGHLDLVSKDQRSSSSISISITSQRSPQHKNWPTKRYCQTLEGTRLLIHRNDHQRSAAAVAREVNLDMIWIPVMISLSLISNHTKEAREEKKKKAVSKIISKYEKCVWWLVASLDKDQLAAGHVE